jgi:hypothetical protein
MAAITVTTILTGPGIFSRVLGDAEAVAQPVVELVATRRPVRRSVSFTASTTWPSKRAEVLQLGFQQPRILADPGIA